MKLKHLFVGILAMGMFAACNDDVTGGNDKVLENETKTFVKISLVNSDGGTRAFGDDILDKGNYEDGLDSENIVKTIKLVFFDQGRNYIGETELSPNEVADEENPNYTGQNPDLTISRILTTVAEVNLPENINHPRYVMAYVNPTTAAGDLSTTKLEDVMNKLREEAAVSPNGLTMNNSVYYDQTSGLTRFATEVDFETMFFKTQEEAKKSPGINITVERVQAKVKLANFASLKEGNYSYPNNDGVAEDDKSIVEGDFTLQFVPKTWFVNATEKKTFLIKNFRSDNLNYFTSEPKVSDWGVNFANLQKEFTGSPSDGRENYINDQTRKRCYWAYSPTYFYTSSTYPDVSYDVKYTSVNNSVNPDGASYPLKYRSYNSALDQDPNGKKAYEYCLENTQNRQTLVSEDAKASLTSVVMLGHYIVKDKDGKTVFNGASSKGTFYIRHNSKTNKQVLLTDEDAMDFFLERTGSTMFIKVPVLTEGSNVPSGKFVYQPLRAANAKEYGVNKLFVLGYPADSQLGENKVSEQWRTLRFKKDITNDELSNIYIYDPNASGTDEGYRPVTTEDLTDLRKRMYSTYGVLESFKNGKAYFNVPLKHIFGSGTTSNDIDTDNVKLGDYGVVRNHVYSLTINKINGLGSGIGDLDQPIVPPTEADKYYISAKLNILRWRIVGQSVDL